MPLDKVLDKEEQLNELRKILDNDEVKKLEGENIKLQEQLRKSQKEIEELKKDKDIIKIKKEQKESDERITKELERIQTEGEERRKREGR